MPKLTKDAKKTLVQERRKQILDAAARVFSEKGFDRATIRDIARAAGVAEGSIYVYFKNKQDLLIHLPRQFVQPRLDAFEATGSGDLTATPPEELLRFIANNMVQVLTQNKEIVRVLMTSLPLMDEQTRAEYMRDLPQFVFGILEEFLRTQQVAGTVRADLDPAITARIFPSMMLFFMMIQEIVQPHDMERFGYDEIINNVVRVFLHGVISR